MFKIIYLAVFALVITACGDDKAAGGDPAAPAADAGASMEAPVEPMAMDDSYGKTIDHSRDVAEFELRRSIAGHERMIAQYTADGYATDELEAHKAELSAKLDALLAGG